MAQGQCKLQAQCWPQRELGPRKGGCVIYCPTEKEAGTFLLHQNTFLRMQPVPPHSHLCRCLLNEGWVSANKILHFSDSVTITQCIISVQHTLLGCLIHSSNICFERLYSSVNRKQLIAIPNHSYLQTCKFPPFHWQPSSPSVKPICLCRAYNICLDLT